MTKLTWTVKEKQDSEERRKNWKHTSCMCHKEACQRDSWAHLAQNSIPTWKSEIPSWIFYSKFNLKKKKIQLESPNHPKNWMNWNQNQLKDYLQQHPLTEQMCLTFQTRVLLHPAPNQTQFHNQIIFTCKSPIMHDTNVRDTKTTIFKKGATESHLSHSSVIFATARITWNMQPFSKPRRQE